MIDDDEVVEVHVEAPEFSPKGDLDDDDGWAMFSGRDEWVRAGLNSPEMMDAIGGVAWLFLDHGPATIDEEDQPLRGSLAFPAGTTYPQATKSLYTSLALVGRLPDASGREALIALDQEHPLGSLELIEAEYLPPGAEGGLAEKHNVWDKGSDDRMLLGLTAPFGVDQEEGWILSPAFYMPDDLDDEEVERRIQRADETNAILPRGAVLVCPEPTRVSRGAKWVPKKPPTKRAGLKAAPVGRYAGPTLRAMVTRLEPGAYMCDIYLNGRPLGKTRVPSKTPRRKIFKLQRAKAGGEREVRVRTPGGVGRFRVKFLVRT